MGCTTPTHGSSALSEPLLAKGIQGLALLVHSTQNLQGPRTVSKRQGPKVLAEGLSVPGKREFGLNSFCQALSFFLPSHLELFPKKAH